MNEVEFKKIAMAIKTSYPSVKVLQDKESIDIWFMMLSDLQYSIVQPAILEHISTSKWPPTISEIREKCASYTSLPIMEWGEAWEKVIKAISRYGMYQEEEALASMDEMTMRCTKMLGFVNICRSENITADRANFRMIYENEMDKKKNSNQIPEKLRNQKSQMIEELVNSAVKKIEMED